jgi:NADPH:quinone reductase-like Zn-dependent oxidoreductase
MKAYRIYSSRKQDALELIEHTVSNPTVREVRVRVRAVSLNYRDLMIAWANTRSRAIHHPSPLLMVRAR